MPTTEMYHESPRDSSSVGAVFSGLFLPPIPPTRPLSLDELRRRVEGYQNQQRLFGLVLIVGSFFAWIIYFSAIFFPIAFVLRLLGLPWLLAAVPALLGMAPPVGYGIWKAVELMGYDDDRFLEHLMDTSLLESSLNWPSLDYAIAFTLLIELALAAPKSALMAVQVFRKRKLVDDQTVQEACEIRQRLFASRDTHRWLSLHEINASPRALILLHELKLITVDEKDKMVRLAS